MLVGTRRRAWGVVVPDLPGCFSAADSGVDEAIDKAREAIAVWIEAAVDAGEAIPVPSSIDALRKSPDYEGWIWAVVDVDPAILDETVERVTITLPWRALARLDAKARQAGATRSGFIAQFALAAK
jgi:predicted RNase H-like HicB family nuclease